MAQSWQMYSFTNPSPVPLPTRPAEPLPPAYDQSTYESPAYSQPAHHQPTYNQSACESAYDFDYEIEGPPFTCGICLDEKPRSESYIFDCVSSHTFCLDCSRETVRGTLEGNGIPKCPGERCDHEISQQEVKQLVPEQLEKYSDLLLKRLFAQQGTFLVCKCRHVMAARYDGQQERCDCPKCHYVFCSLCNEDYHYRSTCQELVQYRNIWTAWLRQGRKAYHQTQKQQRKEHEKQTEEYITAQKKHEEDRAAALQAFETLQRDERYKAQRAKRCPHCSRVVERITGCDHMKCGQDKYGGNVQSGCGKEFSWGSALPYTAEAANTPKIDNFILQAPQQAADFRHEFVRCDNCGVAEIVGLRFECLHCPAYDLCATCEQAKTNHDQRHVFRIWRNNHDNGIQ